MARTHEAFYRIRKPLPEQVKAPDACYPVQVAGAAYHQEYWIPAEALEALNAAIVGLITVIATYRGDGTEERI